MSDNKKNVGKQDNIRVDSNDASEVNYLHRQYSNFSQNEIKAAIRATGPIRSDIDEYLQKER